MSRGNRGKGGKSGKLGKANNPRGQNPDGKRSGSPSDADKGERLEIAPAVHVDADTPHTQSATGTCQSNNVKQPKPDWMTRWTGALVFLAGITCFIMIWQNILINKSIVATEEANKITRNAYETSQRAWVSAYEAKLIDGNAERNVPTYFIVNFKNVGEQPAFRGRIHVATALSAVSVDELRKVTLQFGVHDCVAAFKTFSQHIYFPEQNYFRSAPIETGAPHIPIVHGCIVYETMGVQREYTFCYYWGAEEGKLPSQWESRMCPAGNFAN